MAKLHFKYGAMNCGKSTRLIQEAYNYEEGSDTVLVSKPAVDTKGKDKVVSRLGIERDVDVLIGPDDSVIELFEPVFAVKAIHCVMVDEAQFLQKKQVEELYWEVSQDRDIPVITYGLRADFLAHPFPASELLMTLADGFEELPTVCGHPRCAKKARFNARLVNGQYVFEGEQVAIDGQGEVSYTSLCKKCYRREYLAATTGATLLNSAQGEVALERYALKEPEA